MVKLASPKLRSFPFRSLQVQVRIQHPQHRIWIRVHAERDRPRCQEAGGPGMSRTKVPRPRPPPPARPRAREVAGSGEGRYLHLPLFSVRNSEGHPRVGSPRLGREGGSEIGHAGGVRHVRRALDGRGGVQCVQNVFFPPRGPHLFRFRFAALVVAVETG